MTKLYHGSQGWQVPGSQDKAAVRADVPNGPAELAAWLNDRGTPATIGGADYAGSGDPLDRYVAKEAAGASSRELAEAENKARRATAALERASAEAIADWIFDHAKPAQVEQLFAALGARFHEMRSK